MDFQSVQNFIKFNRFPETLKRIQQLCKERLKELGKGSPKKIKKPESVGTSDVMKPLPIDVEANPGSRTIGDSDGSVQEDV